MGVRLSRTAAGSLDREISVNVWMSWTTSCQKVWSLGHSQKIWRIVPGCCSQRQRHSDWLGNNLAKSDRVQYHLVVNSYEISWYLLQSEDFCAKKSIYFFFFFNKCGLQVYFPLHKERRVSSGMKVQQNSVRCRKGSTERAVTQKHILSKGWSCLWKNVCLDMELRKWESCIALHRSSATGVWPVTRVLVGA